MSLSQRVTAVTRVGSDFGFRDVIALFDGDAAETPGDRRIGSGSLSLAEDANLALVFFRAVLHVA